MQGFDQNDLKIYVLKFSKTKQLAVTNKQINEVGAFSNCANLFLFEVEASKQIFLLNGNQH
jgi:hypothetical protein